MWMDIPKKKWYQRKPKVDYSEYIKALNISNFLIAVEYPDIIIVNFHIPYFFTQHGIRLTFVSLMINFIRDISISKKFIIAGDFNFTPNDPEFEYLTTGKMDDTLIETSYPPNDTWRPPRIDPVYFVRHFLDYTIFTSRKNVITQGIHDHIFTSERVKVLDIVHHTKELHELLPNKKEPSDHILIWCEFEFRS